MSKCKEVFFFQRARHGIGILSDVPAQSRLLLLMFSIISCHIHILNTFERVKAFLKCLLYLCRISGQNSLIFLCGICLLVTS